MSTQPRGHRARPTTPSMFVRRKPLGPAPAHDVPAENPVVGLAVYRDGEVLSRGGRLQDALDLARRSNGFVWVGLYEPSEEEFGHVADVFGLHPLVEEDAVNVANRPKLEDYDERILFLVLKSAMYVEHDELTATSEVIRTSEVMVMIGEHFAVTVRHGDFGAFGGLRHRLEHTDRELLALGPASVMYAIADVIVDRYLEICTEVETDLDELEASVFSREHRGSDVGRIYQLKRELLELRRAVIPLVRPISDLATRDHHLIPAAIQDYFRDVDDHLGRVRDTVTGLDELLTSILQASIARISLSENEDMRKITSWAAIAAVPTAIAGIYGMNFKFMPELDQPWGYPAVLLFIVVVCTLLYRGFKRNHWL